MRSKLLKILSVLVAVIIAFSCCCISVSAKSVITNFSDFISIVDASLNLYKSSSGGFVNVTSSFQFGDFGSYIYNSLKSTESWGAGQLYRFIFSCDIDSDIQFNDDTMYYGSFELWGDSSLYRFLLDNGAMVRFTNSDGSYTFCNLSLQSDTNLLVSFTSSGNKTPIALHIFCDFTNKVNVYSNNTNFSISIAQLKFNQVSDSELITDNQNANTDKIINNQNSNADKITNNQNYNADRITNNQNNNTNQIIGNQNSNADSIKQNQNENTDKILNGDSDLDSSGETDKVNGTIGGVDDATNNALGGKSEEEIQNEVSGALDTDNIDIDWTKANRMSTFYDRCLKAFGSEYSTLLLLSLILGLSAFLIGRRYG